MKSSPLTIIFSALLIVGLAMTVPVVRAQNTNSDCGGCSCCGGGNEKQKQNSATGTNTSSSARATNTSAK